MATPPAAADSKDPAEGPGSAVARTESSYEPHALHLYCPGTVVHVYYVQVWNRRAPLCSIGGIVVWRGVPKALLPNGKRP